MPQTMCNRASDLSKACVCEICVLVEQDPWPYTRIAGRCRVGSFCQFRLCLLLQHICDSAFSHTLHRK